MLETMTPKYEAGLKLALELNAGRFGELTPDEVRAMTPDELYKHLDLEWWYGWDGFNDEWFTEEYRWEE